MGNTVVPISRPSITMPLATPIFAVELLRSSNFCNRGYCTYVFTYQHFPYHHFYVLPIHVHVAASFCGIEHKLKANLFSALATVAALFQLTWFRRK